MVRKKPKDLIMHTFDKYEVWWTDHISHNQWKTMVSPSYQTLSVPQATGIVAGRTQYMRL